MLYGLWRIGGMPLVIISCCTMDVRPKSCVMLTNPLPYISIYKRIIKQATSETSLYMECKVIKHIKCTISLEESLTDLREGAATCGLASHAKIKYKNRCIR
jgi:hypothetical protein